jgi:hypothetical protein
MPDGPTRAWRLANRASILLLLAAGAVPLVGTLAGLDLMPEGNDMRQRSPAPGLPRNFRALREWPERFEAYVNDSFGFRGPLIRGLSRARVFALGVTSSANVVLGRDGWLFYSHAALGTDYDEVRPFDEAELERWRQVLEARQEWLRRRGCRYVLFLPPDKQTVYPEHTRPELRPRHASGRLDQLVSYLRTHSPELVVIDIRHEMLEAKPHEPLYYETDSHWNSRGAYLGYRALAEQLAEWFPQVRPVGRERLVVQERDARGGDLAGLLDLRDLYREHSRELRPGFPLLARESPRPPLLHDEDRNNLGRPWASEHPDSRLPRGVLFHDSFGLKLQPLLSEHFQRLAMIWNDEFLPYVVEQEQPDVVIHQLLERKLGFFRPRDVGDR